MSEDFAGLEGLDTEFGRRMAAFLNASGGRLSVLSGFRTFEEQQGLYNQAVIDHGEAAAGRWAAPPGRSNHNHGLAVDLTFVTDDARQWAHANAGRFGLEFPMSWENWHIEAIGTHNGTFDGATGDYGAYTTPPLGESGMNDPARYKTYEGQMQNLLSVIANDQSSDDGLPRYQDASIGAKPQKSSFFNRFAFNRQNRQVGKGAADDG